jgi:hypothetical protein
MVLNLLLYNVQVDVFQLHHVCVHEHLKLYSYVHLLVLLKNHYQKLLDLLNLIQNLLLFN